MTEDNRIIGQKIRSIREFQHLSRENLAEMSNISTQFLSDIETGKKGMTVATLKKICLALHVSSDSIVFSTANKTNFDLSAMVDTVPEEKKREFEDIIQKIIKLI